MKTLERVAQFRFIRPKPEGAIQVLNSRSYLMGEYNQRTGKTSWQRILLATEKSDVESWLLEHYPVRQTAAVEKAAQLRGT
jgi:hypothetical protein